VSSPLLLRVAFWIGAVGFVASLAVHLLSFTEAQTPPSVVLLHLGIFLGFMPVLFEAKAWMETGGAAPVDRHGQRTALLALVRGLPPWQTWLLGLLFAYAFVNFAVGFLRLRADPAIGADARLYSGHWMLFYAATAVLAHRLLALREGPAA